MTRIFCISFLLMMANSASAQHFSAVESEDGISIQENGKNVLFYQKNPKSLNGLYARAGYVHPLYDLNGEALTEAFPEDHPYHHGIFWAWHQIVLNDKKVADGWICDSISWEPVDVKVTRGKDRISIRSVMLWILPQSNPPQTIIRETTRITVFSARKDIRIVDFDIHLQGLVKNLKLGGSDDVKGYGGFCMRFKMPQDIVFLSGDSTVTPQETAVTAGPWMDFSGSFDGAAKPKSGVAVFCYSPAPDPGIRWILRKEKSMQNVAYPGREPALMPDKGLDLRYRMVIHGPAIDPAALAALYRQYLSAQGRLRITGSESSAGAGAGGLSNR